MIAVALLGSVSGAWIAIERRRDRFQKLAHAHHDRVIGLGVGFGPPSGLGLVGMAPNGRPLTEREKALDYWHLKLHLKYAETSRHPWLPVSADPPEPQ